MIFRHNKSGGLYVYICEGQMESNPEQRMAVYKSLQDGRVWIRSMDEFLELERFSDTRAGVQACSMARVFVQSMMFGRPPVWNEGKQAIANMIVNALNHEPK